MDKQLLDLLTEMSKDMKSIKSEMHDFKSEMYDLKSEMHNFKSEMHDLKSEMHNRFDCIEAKLEGVGGQFELTNESRIVDVDFIADKVNKLEKELYLLKTKTNN